MNNLEIFSEFKKYSPDHPFRRMVETCFTNDMTFKEINPQAVAAINILNSISRVIIALNTINQTAAKEFLRTKLKVQNKNSYDLHWLISSLCELSVMFSFIAYGNASDFVYEEKLRSDNNKDVDFSVTIDGLRYHVEVKSPDLVKEIEKINAAVQDKGSAVQEDVRLFERGMLGELSNSLEIDSVDNKVKDFLVDANKKFPERNPNMAINLLVICWDERYSQALQALKAKESGLLTPNAYLEIDYSNIDNILVCDLYQTFLDLLSCKYIFTPNHNEPFLLNNGRCYIIDHNIDMARKALYTKILNTTLVYVDEEYVKENCSEINFMFEL